jgi:DNA-binding CsgD family transcriptional regulator
VEVHGDRPEAALSTVRRLDSLSPAPFDDVAADLAYVLARAGAAVGDGSAVAQAQARIGDLARVASGPNVLAAAEAVRGFAALAEGRAGDAGRRFSAAAALYERAPRAVLAAELWCLAAQAAGPGSAATVALHRARRIAEAHGLGLGRLQARIAAVRDGLSGPPAGRPPAGARLTSREREVVLLAAEGLSNREIGGRLYLAEGTVRNYLSTAFGKLGISRRAELGRLVAGTPFAG